MCMCPIPYPCLFTCIYVCMIGLVGVNMVLRAECIPVSLCAYAHVCLSASVGIFMKQLGPRLAVARRRARQLHMAGKGTSQRAGSSDMGPF